MDKIELFEVGLRNFLSYGNNMTVFPLQPKKPTLIVGRNLDDSVGGQIESNGAGKSTLKNALAVCLYNQTIGEQIPVDKYINYINKKNMEVYVRFRASDGFYYHVERFRKNKARGGDGARILRNTENAFEDTEAFRTDHDITEDSIALINKQIEKIIGIPFDVFARIVLYSASHESFFELPATSATNKSSQSGIIEELFNITALSDKSESLKKINSNDKKELEKLTELNEQIVGELQRHAAQIHSAHHDYEEWNVKQDEKIKAATEEIERSSKIDFKKQREILDAVNVAKQELQSKKSEYKDLSNKIDLVKAENNKHTSWTKKQESLIAEYEATINEGSQIDFKVEYALFEKLIEIKANISKFREIKNTTQAEVDSLNNKISLLVKENKSYEDNKCPTCSQAYADAIKKLEINLQLIEDYKIELSKKDGERIAAVDSLEAEENLLSETTDKLTFSSEKVVSNKEAEYQNALTNVEKLKMEDNPFVIKDFKEDELELKLIKSEEDDISKTIEKLSQKLLFNTERELITNESSIETKKAELERLMVEDNPLWKTVERLEKLELPISKSVEIEELTDKIKHQDFLYKLLTKKDSFIRKALIARNATYLNKRLQHYLQQSGLPHKVVLNLDMTTTISKFGTECDYAGLSTGQRARLELAFAFAARDVLQKQHGRISLCMLDECLDKGLSNVGITNVVKMIKDIAKTEKLNMYVISHRDEIGAMFESRVEIELNNKFSNVVSIT